MSDSGSQPADSPPPPTDIASPNSKFRILVMGKTGCGKSALINKVFDADIAHVSHTVPGQSDINIAFSPSDNKGFIFHDSEGFEPGDETKLHKVKLFIQSRCGTSVTEGERLHAIWICLTTPSADDRVVGTEVEPVLRICDDSIPVIVVFTKYDGLVATKIYSLFSADNHSDLMTRGEEAAESEFEKLCVRPLQQTPRGPIPVAKVSTQTRYTATIPQLVKTTVEQVRRGPRDAPGPLS